MKKNAVLAWAVLASASLLVLRAGAASAVAVDFEGCVITSRCQPSKVIAIEHVWESARDRGGVRLIASSGIKGYCAIAVAWNPKGYGSIIGAAVGQPTQVEADRLAIEQCLNGGGADPWVIRRWWG
jgi:hypothetical protein